MKLLILLFLFNYQDSAKQARLLSFQRMRGNSFLCDFRTMQGDTLRGLPWHIEGGRKARPELNAWHTIYFYPGNRVKIKMNK